MDRITGWHKSSYSLNHDDFCVETARFDGDRVGVRDSKVTGGPVVTVPAAGWAAFIDHVKH
ncbi:DUF397 domain-containing protein [Streptomyces bambusae]|uniref:DUF397 domain-containing protein n=1 Tax=Streptomyces bambusae TaxID=1550616 RepID=UPI001CFD2756|nr:DUF397 domain-containing protein [Streptomyces bambusae]MCB5163831.1 DUF397 domain-containing protein [Streptomyces bambusae]